jgi:hypothetical protein
MKPRDFLDSKAIFSQRDSRWNRKRLGNTPYTIDDWGCTITAICRIAFNLTGKIYHPNELAEILSFDGLGRLYWSSLSKISLRANRRTGKPTFETMTKYQNKESGQNLGMIIELNYNPRHWVALEKNWVLPVMTVSDPIKGYIRKKWKSEIAGYALIEKI